MHLDAAVPDRYLSGSEVIDIDDPDVRHLSARLRDTSADDIDFARAAFEYVRDTVRHSWDAQDPRVTVTASETLRAGVGLCFAKAHLLTAVLRAQGVPTGLCYQRLNDDHGSHTLHGLVAVHLDGAWHRQDPRGNKPGVDAQFRLGAEQLAWPVDPQRGERDYPLVLAEPHRDVIVALRRSTNILDLCTTGLPRDF